MKILDILVKPIVSKYYILYVNIRIKIESKTKLSKKFINYSLKHHNVKNLHGILGFTYVEAYEEEWINSEND